MCAHVFGKFCCLHALLVSVFGQTYGSLLMTKYAHANSSILQPEENDDDDDFATPSVRYSFYVQQK